MISLRKVITIPYEFFPILDPDPHQNDTDPQHCWQHWEKLLLVHTSTKRTLLLLVCGACGQLCTLRAPERERKYTGRNRREKPANQGQELTYGHRGQSSNHGTGTNQGTNQATREQEQAREPIKQPGNMNQWGNQSTNHLENRREKSVTCFNHF